MKAAVFGILFAVSCLSAVSQGQVDTRCVETLFTEVSDCFSSQGLGLSVQSGQQDPNVLMREAQAMNPAVQCQNLDKYKGAIECSLGVLRDCLNVVGMGGSIPDSAKFKTGMEVVCQRQDDFDSECLKAHYSHILACGEETVKSVVKEKSDTLSLDDVICLSADVNYDCSKKYLMSCSKDTLSIYLEQLNLYQVPSACAGRPPGRPGRDSYVRSPANSAVLGGLVVITSLLLHLLRLVH